MVAVNLTRHVPLRRARPSPRCGGRTPQGGRIINNGSISAHVPRAGLGAATPTTKHAITGLTRTLSAWTGAPFDIACGQIDIGNARTEWLDGLERAGVLAAIPTPRDADDGRGRRGARRCCHMATLPPEANVQFMTVMATKMPYIGRG